MHWRSRSFVLAVLSAMYVGLAALRAKDDPGWGVGILLVLPVLLAFVWSASAPPARGEDWVSPATRRAVRLCGFSGALLASALLAPPHRPIFLAISIAANSMASVAALVALARIVPMGGLFVVPRASQKVDIAVVAAVLGALTGALPFAHAVLEAVPQAPFELDVLTTAEAAACLVLIVMGARRVKRLRRQEVGASERANAALWLAALALAVGLPASLLRIAPAVQVMPVASFIGSFSVAIACLAREPTAVARAERAIVVIAVLAAPVGLLAASLAWQMPADAPLFVAGSLAVGILVGLGAIPLARPLGPELSRWLDGIKAATRAAERAEGDSGIGAVLAALREAGGPSAASPELWRADPPELSTVDRAGYAHARAGLSPPPELYALAESEPERTLRTEVLATLEVRRADIRPLLAWLQERDILSATLLLDENGPIGALLLPAGTRTHSLTLEEVRALRALGDRLAALLSVSSALARSRQRELLAGARADREEDRAAALEHALDAARGRNEATARRLARTALSAAYSTAARQTIQQLERVGAMSSPVTLLTPVGIDPIPYAALVHLASPRQGGPFLVVDAADVTEQAEATWRDPRMSPLALADGGTLVVLSAAALPETTQEFLADALRERRSPTGHAAPLDLALVVSVPATVDALVASGRLSLPLADRLGDKAVPLPPLAARAEDLRALFIDRVARIGVRLRGRAMGLDPRALGVLAQHAWPGNELELEDVLARAASVAEGEVVTVAHLERIGFSPTPQAQRRGSRSTSRPPGPSRSAG